MQTSWCQVLIFHFWVDCEHKKRFSEKCPRDILEKENDNTLPKQCFFFPAGPFPPNNNKVFLIYFFYVFHIFSPHKSNLPPKTTFLEKKTLLPSGYIHVSLFTMKLRKNSNKHSPPLPPPLTPSLTTINFMWLCVVCTVLCGETTAIHSHRLFSFWYQQMGNTGDSSANSVLHQP